MIIKSYLLEKSLFNSKSKILLFYGENLGFKNDIKIKIKQNNKKAFIKNIDQDEIIKNKDYFLNEILHQSLFDDEKIYFINQASDKIVEFTNTQDLQPSVYANHKGAVTSNDRVKMDDIWFRENAPYYIDIKNEMNLCILVRMCHMHIEYV